MTEIKNYTAAELAKLLNLSTETVRKRAGQGKIPGFKADGKWVFSHSRLLASGILKQPAARRNVTSVYFLLDRSGSMGSLLGEARRNLSEQIDVLRKSAGPNDEYRINVINFGSLVELTVRDGDLARLPHVEQMYLYASGSTVMNDAIIEAIRLSEKEDDGERAFLVSILTDGGENGSSNTLTSVNQRIDLATRRDRYTFVYAGPRGSEQYARSIGIPAGNTTSWEQTYEGISSLGRTTNVSLNSYARSRSIGTLKSASFYANPVDPNASDFANKLENKLGALAPAQYKVERVDASDPIVIKKFCEKKFGSFPKGKVYYQLSESEKVQDYKQLVVQDTATGKFYAGQKSALTLLGIPNFTGTVKIKPGNLGEFKVFVQSTSVNRKLTPGTAVVYLP